MRDAKVPLLVVSYLFAAVAANLVVARFGQVALAFTALLLIPFDLFARDLLHDHWKGRVAGRMTVLVLAGSLLSCLFSQSASRVALASFCAFATSGAVDAVTYHALRSSAKALRMNASNLASSITDSVVFPLVAFGGLSFALSAAQATSKFVGGMAWTAAYLYLTRNRKAEQCTD